MSCEICGRTSCTASFHSLEEQQNFDDIADKVKDRMREVLKARINRLNDAAPDREMYLVCLDEVLEIIDNY